MHGYLVNWFLSEHHRHYIASTNQNDIALGTLRKIVDNCGIFPRSWSIFDRSLDAEVKEDIIELTMPSSHLEILDIKSIAEAKLN